MGFSEKRYDSMVYNASGNSGLKMPAFSLGMWHNFGSDGTFSTMRDLLRTSFDEGITHFDLANVYAGGDAETNVGKLLVSDFGGYRDELLISTKAGYGMWPGPYGEWGSRKYLISGLDQSLKRLQLDYVDIFYSHRPDPDTPLEETMGALASIVQQGKALYVAISNYSPEMTQRAIELLRQSNTPCLCHQVQYNMLDRSPETGGLFSVLENEGVGAITYCPLAQGRLTDKYLDGIPPNSRAGKESEWFKSKDINEALVLKVRALNKVAVERGQTLAQMALRWNLRESVVASVLIGASSSSQIVENVKALDAPDFSDEELSMLDTIISA